MAVRIALATHAYHAAADADRLAAMDVRSLDEYRALLARILGFEGAVEAALASVLAPELLRDRCKLRWLRRDLRALGMTPSEIDGLPRCAVHIDSVPSALGWLFVVERHTLVAGIVQRELERRLGRTLRGATSYFAACGDLAGARFRALCAVIDEQAALDAKNPLRIVAGASEAFRCHRQWYSGASRDPGPGVHEPALVSVPGNVAKRC